MMVGDTFEFFGNIIIDIDGYYKCNWVGKELFITNNAANNYDIRYIGGEIICLENYVERRLPKVLNNLSIQTYCVHDNILYGVKKFKYPLEQYRHIIVSKSYELSTDELSKQMVNFRKFNTSRYYSNNLKVTYYLEIIKMDNKIRSYRKYIENKYFITRNCKNSLREHLNHTKLKNLISKEFQIENNYSCLLYGPDNNYKLHIAATIYNYMNLINYTVVFYDFKIIMDITKNKLGRLGLNPSFDRIYFIICNVKMGDIPYLFKIIKDKGISHYTIITSEDVTIEILNKFDYSLYLGYCDKYLVKSLLNEFLEIHLKHINDYFGKNKLSPTYLHFYEANNLEKYYGMTIDDLQVKINKFLVDTYDYKFLPITLYKYLMRHIYNIDDIFEKYYELK